MAGFIAGLAFVADMVVEAVACTSFSLSQRRSGADAFIQGEAFSVRGYLIYELGQAGHSARRPVMGNYGTAAVRHEGVSA